MIIQLSIDFYKCIIYHIATFLVFPLSSMRQATYSVGTQYDKDNKPVKGITAKLAKCAQYMAGAFGGCSIVEASGVWNDDNANLVKEKSVRFIVTTSARKNKIVAAAEVLKGIFNQSAVLLEVQNIESSFI